LKDISSLFNINRQSIEDIISLLVLDDLESLKKAILSLTKTYFEEE